MQCEKIANDEGEFGFAIVEHKAACMKFVMNVSRWKRQKSSHDVYAKLRRDIARRGTSKELRRGSVCCACNGAKTKQDGSGEREKEGEDTSEGMFHGFIQTRFRPSPLCHPCLCR